MRFLIDAVTWLADPANWSGPGGAWARLAEHIWYSALAVAIAAVIAIPLGLLIGHTGRGRALAIGATSALRALPSLGLLTLLAVGMNLGLSMMVVPSTIVLVILAIPPLLAGTYAGVEALDQTVVDGARATGFTEWQIVTRVELPLALPMVIGGLRSAALQVIATATISAYLGLGGLGRFILDGLPVRDYAKMLAGALLVIGLALVVDLLMQLVMRIVTPAGVRVARTSGDQPEHKALATP